MKTLKLMLAILLLIAGTTMQAQTSIQLYKGIAPGSESTNYNEEQQYSKLFKTEVAFNVTHPSLLMYKPVRGIKNTGTSVIIAPGGGFLSLSINREGIDLAKYLSKKGITAFVLKYRLAKCETGDPATEMMGALKDRTAFEAKTTPIVKLAEADGRTAIKYLRDNAAILGINPQKIGFIGFSAGATVSISTVLDNSNECPNFVASIYGGAPDYILNSDMPQTKIPLFIAAATNDQLKLTPKSVILYSKWMNAGYPVEMHLFAEGGHGFGMGIQNKPVDKWVNIYYTWLKSIGF